MIEVFRTNVTSQAQADMLVERLGKTFAGYKINFDLEDCDRILRVENAYVPVQTQSVIQFLNGYGFMAEVLPDEIQNRQPYPLYGCILHSRMRFVS